jgi:hypothetical protein
MTTALRALFFTLPLQGRVKKRASVMSRPLTHDVIVAEARNWIGTSPATTSS